MHGLKLSPPLRRLCYHSVCCKWDYGKTTQPLLANFGGKAAHGLWKNPLDFVGKSDHVALELG